VAEIFELIEDLWDNGNVLIHNVFEAVKREAVWVDSLE